MPRKVREATVNITATKVAKAGKEDGKVVKKRKGVVVVEKAPKKEGKKLKKDLIVESLPKNKKKKEDKENEKTEEEKEKEIEEEEEEEERSESTNKKQKINSREASPVRTNEAATDKKKRKEKETVVKNVITTASSPSISHSSHCTIPGTVLVLGMGDLGQLGLGEDIMEKKSPSPVNNISNVIQVVCGGVHTVALDNTGKVYTWGCSDEGALGRSVDDVEECVPGPVDLKVPVVQVSAGDSHTVALTQNGAVYAWGTFRDSDGPFGLVNSEPSLLPIAVYADDINRAIKITSGNNHVLILTEKGVIYSFGCAECGQLGRVPECFSLCGGRRGRDHLLTPKMIVFPRLRKSKLSSKFTDIFTGENCSFAIGSLPNQIYVWGDNRRCQLGLGDEGQSQFVPCKVPEDWLTRWKKTKTFTTTNSNNIQVAGGDGHTIICDSGSVYAAGANEYGQLGLPKEVTVQTTPIEIKKLSSVSMVACGTRCSFALDESGEVYSWGIGSNCQLGCGQGEKDVFEASLMKKLDSYRVVQVSSGGQHTALLVKSRVDRNTF